MIQQYQLDIPKNLIENIYSESQTRKSVNASNRGGYHSKPYYKSPQWFQDSADNISNLVNAEIYNFWLNINRHQDFNEWHRHGLGFKFLGVWYLQVPENSGNLEIETDNRIETVVPYPSLLVIHSCNFKHRVTENLANQDRVSVAFNFK